VVATNEEALTPGMSGSAVRRVVATLADGRTLSFVVKEAGLVERATLRLLNDQGLVGVPFALSLDLATDAPAPMLMEDLGSESRPDSRSAVAPGLVESEARVLAGIHARNLGGADTMPWLPRADRDYFRGFIDGLFREHWRAALADEGFTSTFRDLLPAVEAAADRVVDEMTALAGEEDCLTLAHTDVNPSNVLVRDGAAYLIDWQSAHRAPFYLDVPHHFHTLEMAETYRRALSAAGKAVSSADFAERYRAAARYTALRYVWWTLDYYREDPAEAEPWVRHYLGMIEASA
jgi:hypothetical protein